MATGWLVLALTAISALCGSSLAASEARSNSKMLEWRREVVESSGYCHLGTENDDDENPGDYMECGDDPVPDYLVEFAELLDTANNPPDAVPLVRKELRMMTPLERGLFLTAINSTSFDALASNGSLMTYYMTGFSGLHNTMAAPTATMGPSVYGWHREQLVRIERALARILGGTKIPMPYINFELDSYLPEPRDSIVFSKYIMGNCGCSTDVLERQMDFGMERGESDCITNGTYAPDQCASVKSRACLYSDEKKMIVTPIMYNELKAIVDNLTTFAEYGNTMCIQSDHNNMHSFISNIAGVSSCETDEPIANPTHAGIDLSWEVFRQYSQETEIDSEYPDISEADTYPMVTECKQASSPMIPWGNMTVIDSHSKYYTESLYVYETPPVTCSSDGECGNVEMIWCDTQVTQKCISKVKLNGVCTGLPDRACYDTGASCTSISESKSMCLLAEPTDR